MSDLMCQVCYLECCWCQYTEFNIRYGYPFLVRCRQAQGWGSLVKIKVIASSLLVPASHLPVKERPSDLLKDSDFTLDRLPS